MAPVSDKTDRECRLARLRQEAEACHGCPLSGTRTNAVFGNGSASSRMVFVGEAPGYHEDQQGIPFVGRAGSLLDELLGRIGLDRSSVYVTNVLKCRPPKNRDPQADEIESCLAFLQKQLAIIKPDVVCTLGNFATKLLSGKPDGITRVHGRTMQMSGAWGNGLLFPVFHPAAALYTPANLAALARDFDSLAGVLGETAVDISPADEPASAPGKEQTDDKAGGGATGQLGLF